MSNGAMKLTLAAAVVTTAASLLYASAFSGKSRRDRGNKQHFNVPNEILQSDECKCKEEVVLAVRLALEGKRYRIYCSVILVYHVIIYCFSLVVSHNTFRYANLLYPYTKSST